MIKPSRAIDGAFFWSFLFTLSRCCFEGDAKSLLATLNHGRQSIDNELVQTTTRNHIYTSLTALEDFPDDDDFYIDTLYGSSSDISDDGQFVIIGAKGTDDTCFDYICPGRVFIYRWILGEWAEDAVLRPPSFASDEEKLLLDQVRFGESVAINGKFALVSAPYHGGMDGRVYVYRNIPSTQDGGGSTSRWEHFTTIVGEKDEFLGQSIGLDGDNDDVAIVGASEFDEKRGKAYVYSIGSDPAVKLAELAPNDRRPDDRFGDAVDIRGEFAIVGSPRHDIDGMENMGAAYIFRKMPLSGWVQVEKLEPFGGLGDREDNFGFSVAIHEDLAVVGAPADSATDETNFGSAYVFRKVTDGNSGEEKWISDAHLYDREDANRGDLFGKAVAVYENRIFFGAPGRDKQKYIENSGIGYFFREEGCLWVLEDVIEPDDLKGYRAIGTSVGLGASGFVVGGIDGIAYVGRFDEEEEEEEPDVEEPQVNDDDDNNPDEEDHVYDLIALEDFPYDDDYYLETYFGYAVGMSSDGNYVIVGAKGVDENCFPIEQCPGRVFIYGWDDVKEEWLEHAILMPENAMDENEFGAAVAIDGEFALVGAPYHDNMNGSVYVYQLSSDGSNWKFYHRIAGWRRGFFGGSMALNNDIAIIGAVERDLRRGRAYIYKIASKPAVRLAELIPSDGRQNDRFGDAVDIYGDFAIVGSPFHDSDGLENMGAAYIYRKTNIGWVQDQKVIPSDGYGTTGDNFGSSVSIHGDLAAVGAPADSVGNMANYGSVYVFRRGNDDWTFEAQLLDRDGGSRGDLFGKSVGVYESRIFVGAPGRDYSGDTANSGKGYLFIESGPDWIQEDFVEPDDLIERRAIGTSIAVGKYGFIIGGIDGIAYVGRFKDKGADDETSGLISSIESSKNTISFSIRDFFHFNLRDKSFLRQP